MIYCVRRVVLVLAVSGVLVGCADRHRPAIGRGPSAPDGDPDASGPVQERTTRPAASHAALAREILEATGVKGGLIVHVGCGDGKLTAALRADGSYLVHGLDRDPANVAAARAHVRTRGLYGAVSVDLWRDGGPASRMRGGLPYVGDLVNLVVLPEANDVPMEEVMRVLCPSLGAAPVVMPVRMPVGRRAVHGRKTVKPWTGEIRRTVEVPYLISPLHHWRCYRSKATRRFLLLGKRGRAVPRSPWHRTHAARPVESLRVVQQVERRQGQPSGGR